MLHQKKRSRDLDALEAAYLYSDGLSQEEIARSLGKRQPEISRLLQRAKDRGWLQTNCKSPPELQGLVETRIFPQWQDLKDRLDQFTSWVGTPANRLRVVDSGGIGTTDQLYDERLKVFGKRAARHVVELLSSTKLTAITWGKTLECLLPALRMLCPDHPRRDDPVTFVPVCGEPDDAPHEELSASSLAHEFSEILNGEVSDRISLGGLSASIRFIGEQRKLIKKHIERGAGYRRVFLGTTDKKGEWHAALVTRIDSVLTSVASLTSNDSWVRESAVAAKELLKVDLDKLTIGNIAGFFLPHPDLDDDELELLDELNEQWTGITEGHFKDCAQRGSPGVVILAVGASKAQIVRECLKRGLVNQLIIDHDLAVQLLSLLTRS